MPEFDLRIQNGTTINVAGPAITVRQAAGMVSACRRDTPMACYVIVLVSAALILAGCAQKAWEADKSRYPTKAQQEAAFERHSERCQMRSRVIHTPSRTLRDTQSYRQGHRIEYDRALFTACMEAAGFRRAGSDTKRTPPAPLKTAENTEDGSKKKTAPTEPPAAKDAEPPAAEAPASAPRTTQAPEAMPPRPAPNAESMPSTPPTANTMPAAAPTASASMAAANSPFRIQLGSYRSRATAEKEWLRLRETWPEIFASEDPIIAKKTLAGRGTFYRLQKGGFDTMQEARRMCATLRAKKLACFPLRNS